MLEGWGDRYCLIGPYNPSTAALEFEEQPAYGSIRETLHRRSKTPASCYFGRWLIAGRPRVILIDYRATLSPISISTNISCGPITASPFQITTARSMKSSPLASRSPSSFGNFTSIVKDRPILAHFHEWMGGVAVPRIAHMRLPIATIFTTHATLLGRYLASDNPYFYEHLPFIDADKPRPPST